MATEAYTAHKERSRERQAQISREGRDLGQLPPPADAGRRGRCERDFRAHLETYKRHRYPLAWSNDHLDTIANIEKTVLIGGCYAYAMPRGSGKTTLLEDGVEWAAVNGHRRFAVLLGVSKDAAAELLASIKFELETNELLASDYPEVCLPIRALEGRANRCRGQLVGGKPTRSKWATDEIVLPSVAGSKASGFIIRARGLLGRIRGMKADPSVCDGDELREPPRPDLVAIDDPQDDETAASEKQIKKRIKVINSTVLGLAGPGKKIAGFMPCTVIQRDDVADQALDRTKSPAWHGRKMKMLYALPTNLDLWGQYWELRVEDMIADRGPERSNRFYADHRAEMDAGAVAAWAERFMPDELSAVQHAMNIYFEDPERFASECQNEPLRDDESTAALSVEEIKARCNKIARGVVPIDAQFLTSFIDVHDELLYWMVCAWRADFTGSVVAYGTYPEQSRRNFTLRTARPKLSDKHGSTSLEAKLFAGLDAAAAEVVAPPWKREAGGDELRVGVGMVDARWGDSTATVKLFCKTSACSAQLLPSMGVYVGASTPQMSKKKRKPGDRVGPEWIIPAAQRKIEFDSNHWKSFIAARLRTPVGAVGALTLFGDRGDRHDLLSSHWTAEYPVGVEGRGRKCDEWKLRPGRDNHWWDCVVGCAVGASTLGVTLPEAATPRKKRKVVSFAEQQRQAKQRRAS